MKKDLNDLTDEEAAQEHSAGLLCLLTVPGERYLTHLGQMQLDAEAAEAKAEAEAKAAEQPPPAQ